MVRSIEGCRPLEGVRVLIVDDDDNLRGALRRILEHAGCSVIDSGTPAGAIEACRTYDGKLDIALVDILMPEMSGPELADMLLSDRPELAIGFMSGYYADMSGPPQRSHDELAPLHIRKPFVGAELVESLRNLIVQKKSARQ